MLSTSPGLDAHLARNGLDREGVLAEVRKQCYDSKVVGILAAGSIVEGLGNETSDLDVYCIEEERQRGGRISVFALGGTVVDLERWAVGEVETALECIEAASRSATSEPRLSAEVLQAHLDLVHRLSSGTVLSGDERFVRLCARAEKAGLARVLRERARLSWCAAHSDAVGAIRADDRDVALGGILNMVDFTLDAAVYGSGETNPRAKWRLKLIRRVDLGARGDVVLSGERAKRLADWHYRAKRQCFASKSVPASEALSQAMRGVAWLHAAVQAAVVGGRWEDVEWGLQFFELAGGDAVALARHGFRPSTRFAYESNYVVRDVLGGTEIELNPSGFRLLLAFTGGVSREQRKLLAGVGSDGDIDEWQRMLWLNGWLESASPARS